MSIALTEQGTNTNGSSSTVAATTLASIPAGSTIIVITICTSTTLTALSDGSSTYNLNDATVQDGGGLRISISAAHNVPALAGGSTVTATFAASSLFNSIHVISAVSTGAGGAKDVSATATQGVTTAPSVGPTAATALAEELVIAAFSDNTGNSTNFTAGGSYTALASTSQGAFLYSFSEYLVTAGTGTQTATGTFSANSATVAGAIVAYKTIGGTPVGGLGIPKIGSIPVMPSVGRV